MRGRLLLNGSINPNVDFMGTTGPKEKISNRYKFCFKLDLHPDYHGFFALSTEFENFTPILATFLPIKADLISTDIKFELAVSK